MKHLGELAAGVSLALLISTAVSAQIVPAVRDAIKHDLGMTDAQLSQYVEIERLAQSQMRAKSQDPGFAGSWIERMPNGVYQYVVASTSPRTKIGVAGMAVHKVDHSLAQLDTAKAELDRVRNNAPAGVYAWGVDVRSNKVRVDVAPGAQQAAIDFVAASGADARTIRFDTKESAPRTLATFYGGTEYLTQKNGNGVSYPACSVGFPVRKGHERGFVTAGHCGTQGQHMHTYINQMLSPSLGAYQGSVFANPGDFAWVKVDGGQTLIAAVEGYGWFDQPVYGSAVAPIGAVVCRSGGATGMRCGQVLAINQTVSSGDQMVGGLTKVKACAENGDSGGPFIDGFGQAQGVLSAGYFDCDGFNAQYATTYFQPINEILYYFGLTLMTQ